MRTHGTITQPNPCRMLGDVAQAAVAKVARTHIVKLRGDSCPQNLYGQRLLGHLSWGPRESVARIGNRNHKQFTANSVAGLKALNEGTYSPQPLPAAVASPESLTGLLENPSRKRRFAIRPSLLRPDFLEPEPDVK